MMFVHFLQGTVGRVVRVVTGLVLIGVGIAIGGAGWILAAIGLVPLAAGALGFCFVAPLLHAPFREVSHQ